MKKILIPGFALCAALVMAGCNSVVSVAPSTTPITANDTYTRLGYTKGTASTTVLMGILTAGPYSPSKSARDEAIKDKGGNALIEVTEEYNVFNFLGIFQVYTTVVEGTAIKFERKGAEVER